MIVPKHILSTIICRFPEELRPGALVKKKVKKVGKGPNLVKRAKNVDIVGKLGELEEKEKKGDGEGSEEEKEVEDEDDEDGGKKDPPAEEEEAEEPDEEMDDETDYANQFFDNGENYLDEEEDNLDEGGIF